MSAIQLRAAMKNGRAETLKVADKWEGLNKAGELKPERWRKIKGWIKLAKDGRLAAFFMGVCISTVDCFCSKEPKQCMSLYKDDCG